MREDPLRRGRIVRKDIDRSNPPPIQELLAPLTYNNLEELKKDMEMLEVCNEDDSDEEEEEAEAKKEEK